MKNFITSEQLKEMIKNEEINKGGNKNLIILDARYDLHNKGYGLKKYKENHVKNSYYIDLDIDLVGEKKSHGGSRPLPKLEVFIKKVESIGIKNNSSIVIYDENMIVASRIFWMFKYIGHKDVKILDGGYNSWLKANGKVTSKETELTNKDKFKYKYNLNKGIYSDISEVKEVIQDRSKVLVECRSYDRYLGNNEPFYSKPGHIPKAICIDSKSLLDSGKLKLKEELEEVFDRVKGYKDIIFSCGSGVNASLDYAVYDEFSGNGKVYIGSYSDWISYEDNPIETKDEN